MHADNDIVVGVFTKHPLLGTIFTLGMALIGRLFPILVEVQIPILYMQMIQICVWTIGGVVGVLTIRGFFKKKQ